MGIFVLSSCNSSKNSFTNRQYQNLTTQFNILFHGNERLREVIEDYEEDYVDDYNKLLPVFKEPNKEAVSLFMSKLEGCSNRANTIIDNKPFSMFHDEAYLLLGKSSFYQGSFFSAIEYFNYVQKHYPKSGWVYQESLIWESRALLNINRDADALDTLAHALKYHSQNIKTRYLSEIYATLSQLYIHRGKYQDAIDCINTAIDKNWFDDKRKIRWLFIRGQIHDLRGDTAKAFASFKRVANSNADFELAFNADLQKLKFQEYYRPSEKKITFRIKRLKKMLKEDNNAEFLDQIYYQLGLVSLNMGKLDEAIAYFKQSAHSSVNNPKQKGISYLEIADLYFDKYFDYSGAESYYDSALVNLPTTFSKYSVIKKKYENLKPLAQLLDSIATYESYLHLVNMPANERDTKINEIIELKAKQLQRGNTDKMPSSRAISKNLTQQSNQNFYFYNPVAVSEGKEEFLRRWGERKLEDHWRQKTKSISEIIGNTNFGESEQPSNAIGIIAVDTAKLKSDYIAQLPFRKGQQDTLKNKMMLSYLQVAHFHRDVLNDKEGAIKAYQLYVYKYANSSYAAEAYYSLYRLYADKDIARSDYYRSMLINEYQDSRYAKMILDPDFLEKENQRIANAKLTYEVALKEYKQHQYEQVYESLGNIIRIDGNNFDLSARFYYLHALALGHLQPLDSLLKAWQYIVTKYPKETTLISTINRSINIIDKNRTWLSTRNPVLLDNDESLMSDPFLNLDSIRTIRQERNARAKVINKPRVQFSSYQFPDTASYNFVLAVIGEGINIATYRAKIGQFNRSKYHASKLIHEVKKIDDTHNLIYVEDIGDLEDAVKYYDECTRHLGNTLLKDKEHFFSFVVPFEEFEKLNSVESLSNFFLFFDKYF